jgi:hypothetical protein
MPKHLISQFHDTHSRLDQLFELIRDERSAERRVGEIVQALCFCGLSRDVCRARLRAPCVPLPGPGMCVSK